MKRLILESQVRHACEIPNLDDACFFIQTLLGVTDGGIASIVFSDVTFDWSVESLQGRMAKMREYIRAECME